MLSSWSDAYLSNPLLHKAASLVVWMQDKSTFTVASSGLVDADETPFVLGEKPDAVAHPMNMSKSDVTAWQKYFTSHGLKQPLEQIWEPVIDVGSVKSDRYKGAMIPYYRFTGREKHGIAVEDYDFHDSITIRFSDCNANEQRIDWARHALNMTDRFEITSFSLKSSQDGSTISLSILIALQCMTGS